MKKLIIILPISAFLGLLVLVAFLKYNNPKNLLNNMIIVSSAFGNNGNIPKKFTCDGGDINPELRIENVPEGAKSLVLIVDDPDAPGGTFTHWIVWNINPKISIIKEESVPPGAVEGITDFGRIGYGGPCPPPGKPHRYYFKVYALDSLIDLSEGASRSELEEKIKGHVLATAEIVGIYQR